MVKTQTLDVEFCNSVLWQSHLAKYAGGWTYLAASQACYKILPPLHKIIWYAESGRQISQMLSRDKGTPQWKITVSTSGHKG